MSRQSILLMTLIFILIGMFTFAFDIKLVRAEPKTWIVDDDGPADFHTIQEAIDNAVDGDTIIVNEGFYSEGTIEIPKAVKLIANGTVILDAFQQLYALHVKSDDVLLCGFKIQNARNAAIYLENSENGNITGNLISNIPIGISLVDSSYNNIKENIVEYAESGISVEGYSNVNNIARNNIQNVKIGIYVRTEGDWGNAIYDNNLTNNSDVGILVSHSTQISLRTNNLTEDYIGILAVTTSTSIIAENRIENSEYGVEVAYSSNIWIDSNVIRECNYGIFLESSEYCSIDTNHVIENNYGMYLKDCYYDSFFENDVKNNTYGIVLDECREENDLFFNEITANQRGLSFNYSSGNCISENNFIENDKQIYSEFSINTWEYNNLGNYWSDYDGLDKNKDGLGDSPYIIDTHNKDDYPLVGRIRKFEAADGYYTTIISNSTISHFQYNGTRIGPNLFNGSAIRFDVTGKDGTSGFCRIYIPTALMNGTFRVFVNGTEVLPPPLPLPSSDSTRSYLYFTYTHSTQEVIIIPEFPSFLILPLFMMATLLAVAVYKRKHLV
ncbi:MAG: NosD domain-containing protein [Candidatus Bathyarchaeia archaeon]